MHLPFTKDILLSTPILATKLYILHTRPTLVSRPRLIERLDEGLYAGGTPGVTLISTPAGFGKTIVVTDRFHQKAKHGTMSDRSYELFALHSAFRGDRI